MEPDRPGVGFHSQAKYLTKKTQAASVEAVKMLDEILLQLSVRELGVCRP